jgi:hypothetical protein
VRGLAWLGGQGTRAIAALVFIGIAEPPLGRTLKPFCDCDHKPDRPHNMRLQMLHILWYMNHL